jgi:hypothetical protein
MASKMADWKVEWLVDGRVGRLAVQSGVLMVDLLVETTVVLMGMSSVGWRGSPTAAELVEMMAAVLVVVLAAV